MRLRTILLTIGVVLLTGIQAVSAFEPTSHPLQIAGWIADKSAGGISIQSQATDPLFNQQWNLARLNVPQAWDITPGTSTIIAVIDTGVDVNHPELNGRIWTNPDEVPGNLVDDDHNGFVDDYNGYNFVNSNINLADGNGHGTGIASIIAANTNNGIGLAGINRAAQIMVIKALNDSGGGDFANVISSIRYAVDNGAKIINMSFGSPSDDITLSDVINYATSRNVIIVSAAGNGGGGQVYYPSAYDAVISVGSINTSDQKSSFSNYGTGLDVVAPGENIPLAYPGGTYQHGGGTSFAAAAVTGVISLLVSLAPTSTPAQISDILHATSTHLGNGTPSTEFGYGVPNAYALLTQISQNLSANINVSQSVVSANGTDSTLVTATITNQAGQLQAGRSISAQLTGSANIINGSVVGQTTTLGLTDQQGQISFRISSVYAEAKQLSLSNAGLSITNSTKQLTFKNFVQPIYKMKWLNQSPYPTLQPGATQTLWVEVQNTGNVAWLANKSTGSERGQAKLGTDRAMDRSSNYYVPATWPGSNRATYMQSQIVGPGATARFEFPITASTGQSSSREYFRPVIEHIAWLNDLGIYWDITIAGSSNGTTFTLNPADYLATLQTQSGDTTLLRGQSGLLTLQIKNTGNSAWSINGNSAGYGRVKLGTANPQDRDSQFKSASWISNNRIDIGVPINPGEVLAVSFLVVAPTQPGNYTESFRLVSEYVSWFGQAVSWNIRVN